MERPIVLITLGALAGALVGIVSGGGSIGARVADIIADSAYAVSNVFRDAPAPAPVRIGGGSEADKFSFSACVRKSGDDVERTLRDLLEFHEHDATLKLVGCLLDGAPQRFCTPAGRRVAADAMEIYYWSREDAQRATPAHDLADKIHWLDRAAEAVPEKLTPDLFALTWSGPADQAILDRLRSLVREGFLDPGAPAFTARAELRDALRGVTAESAPCVQTARGG
jgi:hypothetical protein